VPASRVYFCIPDGHVVAEWHSPTRPNEVVHVGILRIDPKDVAYMQDALHADPSRWPQPPKYDGPFDPIIPPPSHPGDSTRVFDFQPHWDGAYPAPGQAPAPEAAPPDLTERPVGGIYIPDADDLPWLY
jgi:hypothetical protein